MNAAGLDLGSTLGWAIHAGTHFDSGVKKFKHRQGCHPGDRHKSYLTFLRQFLSYNRCDIVFYEKVEAHSSKVGTRITFNVKAAHLYGYYKNTLLSVCAELDLPCKGVAVGRVKKIATSKGNASKDMMVHAARRAFKHKTIGDDNEADALWIIVQGMLEYTGKYIVGEGVGEAQGVMAL